MNSQIYVNSWDDVQACAWLYLLSNSHGLLAGRIQALFHDLQI